MRSIGVFYDNESSGVNACVRVLLVRPIGNDRLVILDYADKSAAESFAEGARAILNTAIWRAYT